jgi:hypothetical protein
MTLSFGLKLSKICSGICAFLITGRVIDPKAFYSQRSAGQRYCRSISANLLFHGGEI